MGDERVFSIDDDGGAQPLTETTLAEAGLWERRNLQEGVIAHPQILGENIRIVAFEFDRWQAAGGDRQLDRLDVLGLDSDGYLVVAELKRDRAPDTVQLQAIKYAAMVSRFTLDDLAAHHAQYLRERGNEVTDEQALELLTEHAPEIDAESLRRPRIVIVASGFRATTTATVVWLTEMGLDITLQQVQLYRTPEARLLLTVSQLYPVPDVEDFTVAPLQSESKAGKRARREKSTVVRLAAAGTVNDGELFRLQPTNEVTAEVREQIQNWLGQDERRGTAIWHNDPAKPLEWTYDGERYRPTTIVQQVLAEAAGIQRSVRGPDWWVDQNGQSLSQLAGPARGGFDWTLLHEALEVIPPGKWTAYQDLADLVGTASQPLGQHITRCPECELAYRVLSSSGAPAEGFRWTDVARTDSPQEVLEAEGVRFVNGKADPAQRISTAEIRALMS
ncbi:hypothetical protein GOHSU_16_01060 [Gordonia hirsuta DSM 44140 = NBRC 16056]|uniref:Uncharacterized protein n=1 Tax=Gordonia hirsuta DSM 44140 = NBRC 16056 TaxID=1121927 RepID=L7LAU2_9ACTN|nr:MGMT family protein [Gordonia hirsuta]GAC57148.1 hypothetical protein GOHSU_16_01060 [Gordonia hirsuta DSM 44140 = NBRC 16056]